MPSLLSLRECYTVVYIVGSVAASLVVDVISANATRVVRRGAHEELPQKGNTAGTYVHTVSYLDYYITHEAVMNSSSPHCHIPFLSTDGETTGGRRRRSKGVPPAFPAGVGHPSKGAARFAPGESDLRGLRYRRQAPVMVRRPTHNVH